MERNPKLERDLKRLKSLLRKVLDDDEGAKQALQSGDDTRILDIACGECFEAETLADFFAELKPEDAEAAVKLTGIDVRAREIANAKQRTAKRKKAAPKPKRPRNLREEFEFLTGDASKLDGHRELGEDFDVVFMRHQNYWNGDRVWEEIFDQALKKLGPDGRLIITSYFDREHELATDAIQRLGGQLIISEQNAESRELATEGKSIDRHVAVFERKK
ncbi:MAG: class I SAM-dependent methyltransferase [Verrucomicrobiales bacterium]|nr:class I SAM-dependent methyltransferase [Verrucomicrobiales bacterium]